MLARGWAIGPVVVLVMLTAQFPRAAPTHTPAEQFSSEQSPAEQSPAEPHWSGVDPVALAAATRAAGWTCLLPHRARSSRETVSALGPAPLRVSYQYPPAEDPTSAVDQPPTADTPTADAIEPSPASQSSAAQSPAAQSPAAPTAKPGYVRQVDGLGTGPGQNPRAQLTGTFLNASDTESFALPMRAGDVLGVTVTGAGQMLELRDPSGTLVEGSGTDRATSYPKSSPLPGGGNATIDHVAAGTGTHVLTLTGAAGAYAATVAVFHPNQAPQRFFLDYRGAVLDTGQFGVPVTGGAQPRTLSPFSAFLTRFGLTDADQPALTARITQTFAADLRASGVDATVSDSTQGQSDVGQPNVTRMIIGGTTQQAGFDTVGISDSVDPGNFDRAETGVVLLDGISEPASNPDSMNHYVGPGSDKVAFLGAAIGNIAAHEAGHLLGSWHTDPNNNTHNVMDSGDLVGAYGYGPDGVGGTADDTRPSFGPDDFAPDEGSMGLENTQVRTAVGLSSPHQPNPS